MASFKQDYTSPAAQAFRDKRRVDSGTVGPYAPANTDPTAYKNPYVAKQDDNPDSKNFYQQAWSSDSTGKTQSWIDGLGNNPNFSNPGDQALAKDFLAKYIQGGERGLVPPEEQITKQTISAFQSKQPGQGIGDGNVTAASRMRYPGASGTQTS